METCNYKFIGKKNCNEIVFIDSKGNPDPKGYCIFHSKLLKEKSERFDEEFKRKFTEYDQDPNKIYDFRGYIFPNDFRISDYKTNEFKKNVNFSHANFHGEKTDFSYAEFHGQKTDFSWANFNSKQWTNFNWANFNSKQRANFSGAEFHGQYTSFTAAEFHGQETDFSYSSFKSKKIDFQEAEFYSKYTTFKNAILEADTINFNDITISNKYSWFFRSSFECNFDLAYVRIKGRSRITPKGEFYSSLKLKDTYFEDEKGLFDLFPKKKKYNKVKIDKDGKRYVKTQFITDDIQPVFGDQTAAKHPLLARELSDDRFLVRFAKKKWGWYRLWKAVADCGRRFREWMGWSLLSVSFFAAIYLNIYQFTGKGFALEEKMANAGDTISMFYYSIVTFTTLGFGDITPTSRITQILVTSEVILGYVMLGGLISILAVKLARRS